MSAITGLQVIYRLRTTIRLLIDYRAGVDSFNLYYCNTSGGTYHLLGNVLNIASRVPATRGKIIYEFQTPSLYSNNWDDDATNYLELATVIGGTIESPKEGPLAIPTRFETILPKEFAVMYGINLASQTFLPISVNSTGEVVTTATP